MSDTDDTKDLSADEESWNALYGYLKGLSQGEGAANWNVHSLENSFFEFIVLGLLVERIRNVPLGEREKAADDIVKRWRRMHLGKLNADVNKHEDIMAMVDNREDLEKFIGDGESTRLNAFQKLRTAQKKVELLMRRVVGEANRRG
jgi:hypothetical protein